MIAKLPKFYLITPDFTGDIAEFLTCLEKSLQCGIRLVQLRSKELTIKKYRILAKLTTELVHSYYGKIILNHCADLMYSVNADGIHLPSAKLLPLKERPIPQHLLLSVACHDQQQLLHATTVNADIALVSPIFSTPSSPLGKPLGWNTFSQWIKNFNIPVYALGGLTPIDYTIAQQQGAYGIAAKRSLWNLQQLCL